jgi:hypothetical protein
MNKISPSRSDFVAERWGQRSLRHHFKLVDKSEFVQKSCPVGVDIYAHETIDIFRLAW